MPKFEITRGQAATQLRRKDVLPGQVFAIKTREGTGRNNYAAIGANGRLYSINLSTGMLSSSNKEDTPVVLTGKFTFKIDSKPTPGVERTCMRSQVRDGEVFTPNGKTSSYLHIGQISRDRDGWLSIPVHNTENHAVSENGRKAVNVTGTFHLDVQLTR